MTSTDIPLNDFFSLSVHRIGKEYLLAFGLDFAMLIKVTVHSIQLVRKVRHLTQTNRTFELNSTCFVQYLPSGIFIYATRTCKLIRKISYDSTMISDVHGVYSST